MANGKNGTKINIAVLHNEIKHLNSHQEDIKKEMSEIKNILINGSGKIAEVRTDVVKLKADSKNIKWLFGITITIITFAVGIALMIK